MRLPAGGSFSKSSLAISRFPVVADCSSRPRAAAKRGQHIDGGGPGCNDPGGRENDGEINNTVGRQ